MYRISSRAALTEPGPKVRIKELQYDHVVHALGEMEPSDQLQSYRRWILLQAIYLCNKCRVHRYIFIVLLQGSTEQQGTQENELYVLLKSWSFKRVEVSGLFV